MHVPATQCLASGCSLGAGCCLLFLCVGRTRYAVRVFALSLCVGLFVLSALDEGGECRNADKNWIWAGGWGQFQKLVGAG